MSRLIILDSGPLGMVTNPKAVSQEVKECKNWFNSLLNRGQIFILSEITDYEVRRELIRAGKKASIRRLNQLKKILPYVPITTETMLLAAQLWAEARNRGQPTADPKALDGDVILAAQAKLKENEGHEVIIATTNVKHLDQFVDCREWRNIL